MAFVIAVAVRENGFQKIAGFDLGLSEDGMFWTEFLLILMARSLRGVQLDQRYARRLEKGDRGRFRWSGLTSIKSAFHVQSSEPGAQAVLIDSNGSSVNDLCPDRLSCGTAATAGGHRPTAQVLSESGGKAGEGGGRSISLHGFSTRTLVTDSLDQSN